MYYDKTRTERIYEYVCYHAQTHNGRFPALRDIGRAVHLASVSSVKYHLEQLAEQGLILPYGTGRYTRYMVAGQHVILTGVACEAAEQWRDREAVAL